MGQDDYTMVDQSQEGKSVATMSSAVGFVFETISEMSIPSIDRDGQHSEATPVVNVGVLSAPSDAYSPEAAGNDKRAKRLSVISTDEQQQQQQGSQLGTGDALNENPKEMSNQIRKAANQMLINSIGLHEFEARYVHRPPDATVLSVAMISAHPEIEAREKSMARRWLDVWDDGSRSYKLLKKKGVDLSGL
jgi:hypothetical protein